MVASAAGAAVAAGCGNVADTWPPARLPARPAAATAATDAVASAVSDAKASLMRREGSGLKQ